MSLFIHFFILHTQRLFFVMCLIRWLRTASFVWIRPLCLLNSHQPQLNSASIMRVRIIYEVAYAVWLIEWQIPWLSDKSARSYCHIISGTKAKCCLPFSDRISQSISVLKYIVSLELLINVLKDTISPSRGQFCCIQAFAFWFASFIFSTFLKKQVAERHKPVADLTETSIVISKVTRCWFVCLALSDWTSPLTNVQWNKSGRKPGKTKCLQPRLFSVCYHSRAKAS